MKLVYWHYHPLSANESTGQKKLPVSKFFQGHTGNTWRKQIVNLGNLASESAFNCNAVVQSILVIDKTAKIVTKKSTFRRKESFLNILIHLNLFLCKYQIIIIFGVVKESVMGLNLLFNIPPENRWYLEKPVWVIEYIFIKHTVD